MRVYNVYRPFVFDDAKVQIVLSPYATHNSSHHHFNALTYNDDIDGSNNNTATTTTASNVVVTPQFAAYSLSKTDVAMISKLAKINELLAVKHLIDESNIEFLDARDVITATFTIANERSADVQQQEMTIASSIHMHRILKTLVKCLDYSLICGKVSTSSMSLYTIVSRTYLAYCVQHVRPNATLHLGCISSVIAMSVCIIAKHTTIYVYVCACTNRVMLKTVVIVTGKYLLHC
jgi:hypothetical protein